MIDQDKSKQELIEELAEMRRRIAALETADTDRKQSEEALRESEERFRLLVEAIPQPIWRSDADGNVIEFNRRWYEYTGQTAEEAKGSGWTKALHSDEAAMVVNKVRAGIASGAAIEIVNRLRRASDGSYRWHLALAVPMNDRGGKIIGWFGCATDIDDQKRAEETLRQSEEALQKAHDELEQRVKERTAELSQSEERYRSLMENIHMGITVMDSNYRIVMLNKGSAERIGRPAEECIGKECFRAFRLHDGVCPDCPGVRAMNTGQPAEVDHTGKYRDGRNYVVKVRAYPMFAADGHAEGFVELIEDIAARKQAEEALAKEHCNLKHLLHASDHERQLIAYEIHDGLAQHLAGAIMQFDTFDHLKETKPTMAAKAFDAGTTMLQQGHNEARRLISGVRPPILDEEGIAAAVGHLVNEQIRLKGPRIEYHSRVAFDRLDPTLENAVYRIVQEALTNACKHSKSQGISVSLLQRGDRLRIKIRDWGVGFDLKAVPKKHFGLEGIRQRARLLGGKCSIQSKICYGTRITVELPVVPREDKE